MELGNLLFGHSRGNHAVERGFTNIFAEQILYPLGFDSYGIPNDDNTTFTLVKDGIYTNGTFTIANYWWGDCTCGADESDEDTPCTDDCRLEVPNFIYHPSEFTIKWYKYALRDAYSNAPLSLNLLNQMIADVEKSKQT